MIIQQQQGSISWSLYILRTAKGTLYTGISKDPTKRLQQHQAGKGAKALRGKGPLSMVYQQVIGDYSVALQLEYAIKQLNKRQKEQIVTIQPALTQLHLLLER